MNRGLSEDVNMGESQKRNAVLPCGYLPGITYFEIMKAYRDVYIEKHEYYTKQSLRNRCYILSANGVLPLIIPICHGKGEHTIMKDVKISYDMNWQKIHWKSIESAYRHSAYFEYFEDRFRIYYEKKYTFLYDYNIALLELLIELCKMSISLKHTEDYIKEYGDESDDFRGMDAKEVISGYSNTEYIQVFSDRFKFVPGLSIIDSLFNTGGK